MTAKNGNGKKNEEQTPDKPTTLMRRFIIVRTDDPTGMSGTGVIGEGIQFTNGSCAYRFVKTDFVIESFAPNVHSIEALHSHLFQDPTEIVWIDDKFTPLKDDEEEEEVEDE